MANAVEKLNTIAIADIEKVNTLTDANIEDLNTLEFAGAKDPTVLAQVDKEFLKWDDGTSRTSTYTTPSGTNRTLIAVCSFIDQDGNTPPSVSGITYDGDSFTEASGGAGSAYNRVQVFYLVEPNVGTDQDLVTTVSGYGGSIILTIGLYWFTAANQTAPVSSVTTSAGTITSGTGVVTFNTAAEHANGGHAIFQMVNRNNNTSCTGVTDQGSDVVHAIHAPSATALWHRVHNGTDYDAYKIAGAWSAALAFEDTGSEGNNQEFNCIPLQITGCIAGSGNQWRWVTLNVEPV